MEKNNNKFANYFFILVIFQLLHSTEEIIFKLENWMPIVSGKVHNIISFVPVIVFPEEGFIIANIILVIVVAIFTRFVYKEYKWATTIAKIASVIEIINGAGHISMAIILFRYFPGCITGIGLIIFGVLCLKNYYSETKAILTYPDKSGLKEREC
jgi:hypothetical protein